MSDSRLTLAPAGSLREIWHIAYPLMLSLLSGSLMLFCDRLILARSSLDAMNAAVSSGMVALTLIGGVVAVTAIVEVFVGQANGRGESSCMGESTWQMVWFSIFASLLFLPVAGFGAELLVSNSQTGSLGVPYFQWMVGCGSLYGVVGAISGFFIGRGRVRLVLYSTILANGVNVVLDLALIPDLGLSGAAIASVVGQLFQFGLLAIFFFNPKSRSEFGTLRFRLQPRLFWDCLRIGVPNSASHFFEMAGWAILVRIVAIGGAVDFTIFAIGQSLFLLFTFISEGMEQAISSIAANYIGAERWDVVKRSARSSLLLMSLFLLALALPLLLFPESFIRLFSLDGAALVNVGEAGHRLVVACRWLWLFFLFDGVAWVFVGILRAGGDTKFIMWVNALSSWIFAIAPVYYFVVLRGNASMVWALLAIYSAVNLTLFLFRYRSGRWRTIALVDKLSNS